MTPPAETVPELETVTGMETLARPAETVMVPVPGAAAVKRPCSSTVPMSPVTSQVKASGSAFREMWLSAAVAASWVVVPVAAFSVVSAVPLLSRITTSVGSSMA